jgi:predicted RNase H-like HicB family nuclease
LTELAKQTFTMVVERDPESGWLVGEVVELPGCCSQAADLQQLEANVREAIEAYLKTKAEVGEHVLRRGQRYQLLQEAGA